MNFMRTVGILAVLALATLLAAASPAGADVYLKQLAQTGAYTMAGETHEAETDTIQIWIAGDKARMQSKDATVIARKDQDLIYFINPEDSTYYDMKYSNLGNIKSMMAAQGVDTADSQQMQMAESMMAMMQVKATVTPTDSTKKIDGYDARKYDLSLQLGMAAAKGTYWVTKDITADYDVVVKLSNMMMLQMPGAAEAIEEMKKMEGVPVESQTNVTVMGAEISTTMKLLEYKSETAPEDLFTVPSGFEKKTPPSPLGPPPTE